MGKKFRRLVKRVRRLERRLAALDGHGAGSGQRKRERQRDIVTTPVDESLRYAARKLDIDLADRVPGFERRYAELRDRVADHGRHARRHMPVIHWREVKRLQRALVDGHLDIRPPYNREVRRLTGQFPPTFDSDELADLWRGSGLDDGALLDDVVDARMVRVAAGDLVPLQAEIFFRKVVKKYRRQGLPTQRSVIAERPLVISRDNEIIDGHHRFAAVYLVDPTIELAALRVDIDAARLLRISRAFGESIG